MARTEIPDDKVSRSTLWRRVRDRVFDRDNFSCVKCGRGERLHAHHIVPRQDGGDDSLENLVTLCCGCHADWHAFEMVSDMSFSKWALWPPTAVVMRVVMEASEETPDISVGKTIELIRHLEQTRRVVRKGWADGA